MKEMILVIRPEQLEVLKDILDGFHAGGMTISSVMGCGTQRGFLSVKFFRFTPLRLAPLSLLAGSG